MIARALLPLAGLAIGGCAPATPAEDSARFTNATGVLEPERSRWTVSTSGIGPLRFGMAAGAVAQVLGDSSVATAGRASCTHLQPRLLPRGVALTLSAGVFVRVDVDSAGVLTDTGIGVGDSEVSVLVRNSGSARIEASKDNGPQGHTLIVTNAMDPDQLMIFETDGRTIQHFRAGTREAVTFVKRCA